MKLRPIQLDEISIFLIICLLFMQLAYNNGNYLFLCTSVFTLLFFLVQQRNKSGVFAFILVQHVIQVIASVWQANYLEKDINYRSPENSNAIILSMVGMVFLFFPIIIGQLKIPNYTYEDLEESASKISTNKAMRLYIISFFIATGLTAVAFVNSSFTQILLNLVKVKWMLFMLFGFVAFIKKEKLNIFYLCIALEIFNGLFSFFSDFKTVIYYLLIITFTLVRQINVKQLLITVLTGVVLLLLGLAWTSIKVDYRSFLNKGQKTQEVTVSRDEALNKIVDLSKDINQDKLTASTLDAFDRLQYTFHFAKTLERVPEIIPYEHGRNWFDDLQFAITPRYLNPDKPTLDNSVKAIKYTGIHYLTAKSGVSFSLGYFAESYIDFGPQGMMIFLAMIGILYSIIYHYLMKNSSKNIIFNYAVVGSFFMEFYAYEMDGTYYVGRLFTSIVTYLLLINFVFPIFLNYIKANGSKE